MATFPESLSETGKENWLEVYKQLMGKEWIPPKQDKFSGIETLSEIDRLMRDKPNSGRE